MRVRIALEQKLDSGLGGDLLSYDNSGHCHVTVAKLQLMVFGGLSGQLYLAKAVPYAPLGQDVGRV
jgi:hypothetical protein